ncbi:MAG: hypothetical protein ACREJ6_07780 [Candidatus Methylomirabilis sp.]
MNDSKKALRQATSGPCRCFETHIRDAIEVNRQRLPLYSRLTNGESEKVSKKFILNQHLVLPITWYVDWRARAFQQKGIPIVCLDMVSMRLAPAFRERSEAPPRPLSEFQKQDIEGMHQRAKAGYRHGGFAEVSRVIGDEVKRLHAIPTYHCMLRHMLESALRCSNLAPVYVEMARHIPMKSPADLSWFLIRLHLMALGGCAELDALAAPLQAQGIPIIGQDVPPITPLPHGLGRWPGGGELVEGEESSHPVRQLEAGGGGSRGLYGVSLSRAKGGLGS